MKKLSFTFTNSQFQQLQELLNIMSVKSNKTEPGQLLLILLLTDIYVKIMKKGILMQDTYTIKLTLPESIAFFCFFNHAEYDSYTMAIVQPMCDEIHSKLF